MALKNILQTAVLCLVLQETSLRTHAQGRRDVVKDPASFYTTTELACSDGYPVQEHRVTTRDGYVITVHRIPNGKRRPKVPRSKYHYHKIHQLHHPDFNKCIRESLKETSVGVPILFVPGLLMASDGWLLQGPGNDLGMMVVAGAREKVMANGLGVCVDDAFGWRLDKHLRELGKALLQPAFALGVVLAYLLVDRGYDVWMANVRGNFYAREHVNLSLSDPRFWNFSFHENAVIDLPDTIDYILKETKQEKIGYVGISMGTTLFFAMSSMLPEYNDKILGFIALAPVAFIKEKNMEPRRRTVFEFIGKLVRELQKKGSVHELFPRTTTLADIGKIYCSKGSNLQDLCYDFVSTLTGYHSKLVLRNKFHLYVTHMPTGTSLKTLVHFVQNIQQNTFKLFDYGKEKNVHVYGTPRPPDYPLRNITAPVALYYTENDFFYDTKDINELRKILPNIVDIDVKIKFNHVDFLWSFNAKDTLYPKALKLFDDLTAKYQQSRKNRLINYKDKPTYKMYRGIPRLEN